MDNHRRLDDRGEWSCLIRIWVWGDFFNDNSQCEGFCKKSVGLFTQSQDFG